MSNDCLKPLLDKKWENADITALIHESPEILEGVSAKGAEALARFFDVNSIAEMAGCEAFLRAQALVTLASAADD